MDLIFYGVTFFCRKKDCIEINFHKMFLLLKILHLLRTWYCNLQTRRGKQTKIILLPSHMKFSEPSLMIVHLHCSCTLNILNSVPAQRENKKNVVWKWDSCGSFYPFYAFPFFLPNKTVLILILRNNWSIYNDRNKKKCGLEVDSCGSPTPYLPTIFKILHFWNNWSTYNDRNKKNLWISSWIWKIISCFYSCWMHQELEYSFNKYIHN